MLTSKIHKNSSPDYLNQPEYITQNDAYNKLGISRQVFRSSGLEKSVERWQVGNTTLYRIEDIAVLQDWLYVREALIALGQRAERSALVPTEDELEKMEHGEYCAICPVCQSQAVVAEAGAWRNGPMWCPVCDR